MNDTGIKLLLESMILAIAWVATGVAVAEVYPSSHGPINAETIAEKLSEPVSIEFLPDGRALVLERNVGRLSYLDPGTGELSPISGLPEMITMTSDDGAHDLVLHPDYQNNGWIYLSYSVGKPQYRTLALDRMQLDGNTVINREQLLVADAWTETGVHYGGRMAFADGYLYVTVGDRDHRERAQELSNHAGSILRLTDEGGVPPDNPFVDRPTEGRNAARHEIWSYGHRHPQGLLVHPDTGQLFANEHGPRGGDEINLIERGANYGWPVVSFGFEYDGGPIGRGVVAEDGMQQPLWVWVPSIAPSDFVYYDAELFPAWKGSFLSGAMAGLHLNRIVMRDGAVVVEERILKNVSGRVRAIGVDAAGAVYLGSDDGRIVRLTPAQ